MYSMSDTDDPTKRAGWTEQIVATSEPEPPMKTVDRLFDVEAGPEQLTEAFLHHDVSIDVTDYFLDEETRHEVHLGETVEYVPCVADALQVAVLLDQEIVTVRSFDPISDRPITFVVGADDLDVDPKTHLVSIGVGEELIEALPDGTDFIEFAARALGNSDLNTVLQGQAPNCGAPLDVEVGEFREVACTFINAFETEETYTEWAAAADAVTVALKGDALMPGTRSFVDSAVFD